MPNPTILAPVKSSVRQRLTPLVLQAQKAAEQRQAIAVDPLMKLSEAASLLGNPSYSVLRKWIKDGSLRVWRAGKGHFRVRLSEIQRFLSANEVSRG
jgi:excisionase family DNA binding protein